MVRDFMFLFFWFAARNLEKIWLAAKEAELLEQYQMA
jgi:hypothetical protein